LKRLLDVTGALIGILFTAPLMAAAAIAIKLDSRGPVLFLQERAGKEGRPFKIFKLRTMVQNAEELLDRYVDIDALEEPVFKLKDDPRVTRVGRILRRWRIDELPQLFNVLRGEMSLVGPRPEECRIVQYYSSWHRQRLSVKPGITGPAQISGCRYLVLSERVRMDIEYVKNHTLCRDIWILIKTIPSLLHGESSC
jgi:lipopolysaccharide/colanic/teichoic acid biosynthesis glycosyltransferase